MFGEQEIHFISSMFFYILDGTVWFLAIHFILTGFYGYPAPKRKPQMLVGVTVVLLYALTGAVILYQSRVSGTPVMFGSEGLQLILLVYWQFQLKEPKRLKRFFITVIGIEFFTSLFMLVATAVELLWQTDSLAETYIRTLIPHTVTLLIIFLFSVLSSKKRKEPMRFPLIVATFLMGVLLDMLVNFVNPAEDIDRMQIEAGIIRGEHTDYNSLVQPIFRFRLLLNDEQKSNLFMLAVLLVIACMTALFLIMLIRESESVYFQKKNAVSEYYLETQKAHYESLTASNREIRKIRHDMKNHIFCMEELLRNKQYAELSEYLGEIDEGLAHAETSVQLGNEIADAIVSEKMKKAAEEQITLEVEGALYGPELKVMDICTIFSNLLDNAIEAVRELPKEQRRITLLLRKTENYFLICCTNPCAGKPDIRDNTIATTKKDKGSHGFGIENIKDAIGRYDGECAISVSDSPEEDGFYTFSMELMLPFAG